MLSRTGRAPRRLLTRLALPVVAALALTACGGDGGSANSGGSGAAGGGHEVKHARGTAKVPAAPKRVVTLEPVQLDTSVALGFVPVGAAVLNETAGVPPYLGKKAAGIKTVGTVQEPNIEKIAALKPDLILGTEARHSALYERLTSVAPTVFMASQTDPWTENVQLVARALGDEKGAGKLLAGYQARCAEVAGKHGTKGRTAQLVRPRDGVLTLYGPTSFAGSTLECAGFTTPERNWENSISVDVSPERVREARADLVIVTAADVKAADAVPDAIRDNAKTFPAPHVVDQSFWISGVGPLGGMAVLDDIDRILTSSK
ncbi:MULTISPECIES: ABC transporter substrate-binding protein [Streptomyces]|uniref:Iron-siderophore ABC transporter substrate-binding protein n=1 Tax=Streptomyces tsukubensis (strain DSM 42081 / NBRC 108919 / NRRL 18488 / 9993) TaxID=1114943 RepID=I2N9W8_STRT9|nr:MULTISPECIES: iron-siderophore ABC transporter substrate-binding protein [Streptomyces]AZK97643.1 iron ABC transporter substrate-binding protein [Streptomyces tsukubensis]EIF93815.1 Fe3+-hydroxamate ABC transporter periplasmic protein [Streptomyces tsukubensis NRRL18488]MYS66403.1 ABC transporter substrate-binding protein [Streptomyces sp. SID5473]QKM66419.1 iron-siderophore ABC transporter substrate-binding protein [Streptomyces tsukubensis NRRL18488]TAI45242.1 iron-siderophore ABC transpo